jgi:hypothetical protein
MEVSLLLIALQFQGATQLNAVSPQVVGRFSSMKACEDAAKGSEFQSSNKLTSDKAIAQFLCVQSKSN